MPTLNFEWLSSSRDCEVCGTSYADGAKVYLNNSLLLNLEPIADCCYPRNYPQDVVYEETLRALGFKVTSEPPIPATQPEI